MDLIVIKPHHCCEHRPLWQLYSEQSEQCLSVSIVSLSVSVVQAPDYAHHEHADQRTSPHYCVPACDRRNRRPVVRPSSQMLGLAKLVISHSLYLAISNSIEKEYTNGWRHGVVASIRLSTNCVQMRGPLCRPAASANSFSLRVSVHSVAEFHCLLPACLHLFSTVRTLQLVHSVVDGTFTYTLRVAV